MGRPTHVLVATSDGGKLTEEWITLEAFAKFFRWGLDYDDEAAVGRKAPEQVLRVAPSESEVEP